MIEIILKVILLVYGCVFICGLCYIMVSDKKEDKTENEKPDIRELYGTVLSIQFWFMISILVFFTVSLVIDIFSFSVLERFVGNLSEFPRSTIETFFSSLVTVLIGLVGFVAIALSILYGAYVSDSTSPVERKKLGWQIKIWFLFTLYLLFTMIFLFILPLMERLGSFR